MDIIRYLTGWGDRKEQESSRSSRAGLIEAGVEIRALERDEQWGKKEKKPQKVATSASFLKKKKVLWHFWHMGRCTGGNPLD